MSFLEHIGVKRRSGRYPWGSGKDPEQRSRSFLGYVKKLQDEGLSEVEIADGLGMTTSQLRNRKSIAKAEMRAALAGQAQRLFAKGMSKVAIGKRMGLNESSVRALLDPSLQERSNIASATANMLRDVVAKKGLIDVGLGAETQIGITRTKLKTALSLLEEEGYKIHYLKVQQLGTGKFTSLQVLAPPEMDSKEVFRKRFDIKTISDMAYSPDGGRSYLGLKPVQSVSSRRIMIRYREDGGAAKDGVIELRRNVEDLSLGNANYAQVRIGVDGTHFLKGMAMYADNLPNGIDIIYNSNKKKGTPKEQVFKEMKPDPDNPFGTTIKPGGQRGALNIVNEEGDWNRWSKTISSQILSKQSPALAKQQLDIARAMKQDEFDEIMQLTNPTVRKKLLQEFSDDADASAVHLKAAALPRQANKVILPVTSLKPNEIYAPSFNDGEQVVLIRHPHGGIFEIPEVRVNNRNKEARDILGNAIDAIGIHPDVAAKLSGADFDGDHVLVIPNKNRLVRTAPTLKALKDFDTKLAYPPYDGMPTIDQGVYDAKTGKVDYKGKKANPAPKQLQMGDVSNLITDMTIKGASTDEIARAVRHSMVVIDSEKHHLDYKRSAIENGIVELKKKYQGGPRSGASTLISRASSEKRVPFRVEGKLVTDANGKTKRVYIDPSTGRKLYQPINESFVNAKGKLIKRTTVTTKMAEETDAFNLSSGTKIESIYAEHANALKALANKARLAMLNTPNLVYSPSAKQTYAPEVERLKAALRVAIENKPRERQAQLLANSIVSAKKQANKEMSKADLKKIKGQALEEARVRSGAHKKKIEITDREWEAIQLGAISNNVLSQILDNMDPKDIKARATPRTALKMTDAKVTKAKVMASYGYTTSEIANALGVSTSSIEQAIK
jgi:DNA-binding CsgD family transcriptional regulator